MSIDSLNWADYAIVGLILISIFLGVRKGLVREALSLATWMVSVWIALNFSHMASEHVPAAVQTPSLRLAIAFIGLLITGLIIGNLLVRMMVELVDMSGLNSTDRMLGMLFGALRGVLIVGVAILMFGMTPLSEDPWWKASRMIGFITPVAEKTVEFLPPELREKFDHIDSSSAELLDTQLKLPDSPLIGPSEQTQR